MYVGMSIRQNRVLNVKAWCKIHETENSLSTYVIVLCLSDCWCGMTRCWQMYAEKTSTRPDYSWKGAYWSHPFPLILLVVWSVIACILNVLLAILIFFIWVGACVAFGGELFQNNASGVKAQFYWVTITTTYHNTNTPTYISGRIFISLCLKGNPIMGVMLCMDKCQNRIMLRYVPQMPATASAIDHRSNR